MGLLPWSTVEQKYIAAGMPPDEIYRQKEKYFEYVVKESEMSDDEAAQMREKFLGKPLGIGGSLIHGFLQGLAEIPDKWGKIPDLMAMPGEISADIVGKFVDLTDDQHQYLSDLSNIGNPFGVAAISGKRANVDELGETAAEKIRGIGPQGQPQGVVESVVSGVAGAPGTLAAMLPFLVATAEAGPIAGPMLGMGLYGATGEADKGPMEALKGAVYGAAEGAAFGGAGELVKPLEEAGRPIAANLIHSLASAGIGGGSAAIHGGSAEDIASSAVTMGLLGLNHRKLFKDIKYETLAPDEKLMVDHVVMDPTTLVRPEPDPQQKIVESQAVSDLKQAFGKPPQEMYNVNKLADDVQPYAFEVMHETMKERPPQSHEETVAQALELAKTYDAKNADKIVEDLVKNVGSTEELAARVHTSRILANDALSRAQKIGQEIKALEDAGASKEEITVKKEQLLDESIRSQQLFEASRVLIGDVGRALNAAKIKVGESSLAEKIAWKLSKEGRLNEEMTRRLAEFDPSDTEGMKKYASQLWKPGMRDYAYELWINWGLLSGIKTHIVNPSSNLIRQSMAVAENAITSVVDPVFAKIQGRDPKATPKDIAADFIGLKTGILPAFQEMIKKLKDPDYRRDELTKAQDITFGHEAFRGKLGDVVRFPTQFLSAQDLFFKSLAETRETYVGASRKAKTLKDMYDILENIDQHRDILKKAREAGDKESYAEELKNFSHQDILERSVQKGREATYTEDINPDSIPGGVATGLMKMREKSGIVGNPLKILLPFMRTPYNIAKQSLERTPAHLIDIAAKAKSGKLSGIELTEELSKVALGSAIMSGIAAMAINTDEALQSGTPGITGAGPDDRSEMLNARQAGFMPHAIKFGDKFFSYDRAEPIGTIIGIAADIATTDWDGSAADKFQHGVKIIKENLTNKTFLVGLENVMKAWSQPNRKDFSQSLLSSYERTLVPAFLRQLTPLFDPAIRSTSWDESPIEPLKGSIPGLSKTTEQRTTQLGMPIERSSNRLVAAFSPMAMSQLKPEASVERELNRLREFDVPMTAPQRKRTVPGTSERVRLSREEYAVFSRYHRMAREEMKRYVESSFWRYLSDDEKARQMSRIYDRYRRMANKEVRFKLIMNRRKF